MTGDVLMRINKFLLFIVILFLSASLKLFAQDALPVCPVRGTPMKSAKPMREMKLLYDTLSVQIDLPAAFKGIEINEIVDNLEILSPVLEHLRLVKGGILEDTVRILHIGDSHIRGHIYPQTTGHTGKASCAKSFNEADRRRAYENK